jgi:tripartite-type tricarboxylate transporter receptor subunit TctC
MPKSGCGLFRLCAGIVACANLSALDSLAQSYPVKPIRVVAGQAPGGSTDVTARIVGQKLAELLGQPVVVENRTGASGSIAAERVATSPADGYTLLVLVNGHTVLPALRSRLPYDLERDFAPVSLMALGAAVLTVHPSVPARNVKELIALARMHPGKLNYGSSGVGGTTNLMGELFSLISGVKFSHVPYKGSAESAIATVAGHIDIGFLDITVTLPMVKSGKLRALAVTTLKRASLMPSIPTLDESGLPEYDYAGWYGLSAPAGVPKDIIARLNAAIDNAVNTAEMKESLIKQGLEPHANTPDQFAAFIRAAIAKNARLVKLAGLKAE